MDSSLLNSMEVIVVMDKLFNYFRWATHANTHSIYVFKINANARAAARRNIDITKHAEGLKVLMREQRRVITVASVVQ